MMFALPAILNQQLSPPPPVVDPYLSNVLILLRGNAIQDVSPSPKTLTNNGVSVSTAITPKYGSSSLFFTGYLTASHSSLAIGLENFTIEAWIYKVDYSGNYGILSYSTIGTVNPRLYINANTLWGITNNNNSTAINLPNQWVHVAFVRSGSLSMLFINGVLARTVNLTATQNHSNTFMIIGAYASSFLSLNGYVNALRVTKGVARYTANFNPETDTYLAY